MNRTPAYQEIEMDPYDAFGFEPAEPDRELCERTADGVEVRLVWRPSSESLAVVVSDTRTGSASRCRWPRTPTRWTSTSIRTTTPEASASSSFWRHRKRVQAPRA